VLSSGCFAAAAFRRAGTEVLNAGSAGTLLIIAPQVARSNRFPSEVPESPA
jgi:hypothetical protein